MTNKYKKSRINVSYHKHFCQLRKEYECLKKFLYRQYLWSLESKIKQNSKAFWSFINTKRKSIGIPSVMELDCVIGNNVNEICDMFASFFQSNFVNRDINCSDLLCIETITDLGHLNITENDILNELFCLKSSTTTAPDNVPPIIFKLCRNSLVKPLFILFNKSMSYGEFLAKWKWSLITPIFKSGSKKEIRNYRPIAKLQLIPKIFEAIVKKKLYSAVCNHISSFQHGFVSGRSSLTNLAIYSNFCIRALENRSQIDCIYTDFSKAFDCVQHNILIKKLELLGFHSNLLLWLTSYLTGRKQYVKIGSEISKEIINFSGVPQGSHLGPLLFLLFINDLPNHVISSNCLLYADDLKLFKEINSLSDAQCLQNDLNNLSVWCDRNGLYFNVSKCSVLTSFRIQCPILFQYKICNISLDRVSRHKDLGVIFDEEMKFSWHYDYIISKANSMLGFLYRNAKDFNDPYTLKSLYNSLIRSSLEYCCVIWSPYYDNVRLRIEKVQRRFTKFAISKLNWSLSLSYEERCSLIDLKPLDLRREQFSALFAHDILSNHIKCSKLLSLFFLHVPSRQLRPRMGNFLNVPSHRTNYGLNDPITRACLNYNKYDDVLDFGISRKICKNIIFNSL